MIVLLPPLPPPLLLLLLRLLLLLLLLLPSAAADAHLHPCQAEMPPKSCCLSPSHALNVQCVGTHAPQEHM